MEEEDFAPVRDAIMDEFYRRKYPYRGVLNTKDINKLYEEIGLKHVCLWCGKELDEDNHRHFCQKGSGHANRFYNRYSWAYVRDRILKMHPICHRCGESRSEEVHHIMPLIEGGSFYDSANLEALCHRCHMETHRELRRVTVARETKQSWEEFYKHQRTLPGYEPNIPDEGVKQE